ncbi:hypothetical protein AB8O64_27125 [Streptomyces sp. QH1-20]|uniref:hypothetical protein n=1 Tax=Streptomyces sp. QH1-20 TaxID=3240934 RepID=UPI00351697C2
MQLALHLMEAAVFQDPAITAEEAIAQVRKAVEGLIEHQGERTSHATCKRCRFPVASVKDPDEDATWVHLDDDYSRGCRAASFGRDGEWDDSLDKQWKAVPA